MKQLTLTRGEYRNSILRILITFVVVALLALTSGSAFSSSAGVRAPQTTVQESKQTDVRELKQGAPIERELTAGQSHSYRITLTSSQYMHVMVEQHGVNVEVSMSIKGGEIASLDWWWREGPESLWVLAETSGDYAVKGQRLRPAC